MARKPVFHYTSIAITALFVFLLTAACHKNKAANEDTGYASDQSTAEKTFTDIQNISDQASVVSSGNQMNYRTTAATSLGCATVYKSADSIVIDFGTVNCTCHDGRTRRGKIIVTYTGAYTDAGSIHTITFDNFYQNDNKITGQKTVTNMGHNSSGQPYFNIEVNGAVTLSGGGTVSANWSRVRTWTSGYNTPSDFTDDVYSISGSGIMIRANGTNVKVNIPVSAPLIVSTTCKWIEAGTITFTLPGDIVRSLNYGTTPVCDNTAQLTLPNGKIIDITKP